MDFGFLPEEEKFKKEVREFFETDGTMEGMKKEIDSGQGYGPYTWEVLGKLGSRGWLTPTWPKEYGGLELPDIYRYIVMEEMDYFTHLAALVGAGMAGHVILHRGSEEQKQEYLPKISKGKLEFALGYTEPEAGSDLANLAIKAEDKGDYFLMNGQKMFNTASHYAHYHWLGARTEVIKPKHRGISLFIVDFKTPGITIHTIRTMAGLLTNEVFYDNVKVPKECLVGEKNRGFYYIMEALDYERIYTISRIKSELDQLVEYAKSSGKGKDPIIRQKLAQLNIEAEIARLSALRIPWMLDRKVSPTSEAAMLKVVFADLDQRIVNTGLQILGPLGQLREDSKWAQLKGDFEYRYTRSLQDLITRGTCEVMKNIVATRGLGLPAR